MHQPTGGSQYDTIIITSSDDIDRYSHRITRGYHALVVLDETGITSIGGINVVACNFCYGYHYVAFDQAGKELSEEELGFDSLVDAIMCLSKASGLQLPRERIIDKDA